MLIHEIKSNIMVTNLYPDLLKKYPCLCREFTCPGCHRLLRRYPSQFVKVLEDLFDLHKDDPRKFDEEQFELLLTLCDESR